MGRGHSDSGHCLGQVCLHCRIFEARLQAGHENWISYFNWISCLVLDGYATEAQSMSINFNSIDRWCLPPLAPFVHLKWLTYVYSSASRSLLLLFCQLTTVWSSFYYSLPMAPSILICFSISPSIGDGVYSNHWVTVSNYYVGYPVWVGYCWMGHT